jgi:ABC-type lipoprotein export system ATPase subunit
MKPPFKNPWPHDEHGLMDILKWKSGLGQRVRELSGGERQRGALVRSLMNNPELLLCDEPTGALDETKRERVFELLLELVRSRGRPLVLATHDPDLAARCDRTVKMRDGRIEGETR